MALPGKVVRPNNQHGKPLTSILDVSSIVDSLLSKTALAFRVPSHENKFGNKMHACLGKQRKNFGQHVLVATGWGVPLSLP